MVAPKNLAVKIFQETIRNDHQNQPATGTLYILLITGFHRIQSIAGTGRLAKFAGGHIYLSRCAIRSNYRLANFVMRKC